MSGQKSSTGLPNAAHGSGEMLSSLEHPLVGSQVQMYPLTGGTSDTPMPSPLTHQLPQLQTQHPLGRPSQLSAPHNPLTSHASHGLPKSSIASSGIVPETGMPSLSQATGLSRQSLSGLVSQPYGSMKDSQVPPLAQPSIHASPGSIHHLRTEPSLNQAVSLLALQSQFLSPYRIFFLLGDRHGQSAMLKPIATFCFPISLR